MSQPRIHWAGGLEYVDKRGTWHGMASGYPCCCYGDKATKVRREGTQTWERESVDCKACLRLLAKPGAVIACWHKRMRDAS